MNKISVGAVSYLNTKPLLYGIERSPLMEEIKLTIDYPARIARRLLNGTIDVGLVPVSIIPQLKESYIITDYCIGADGPVASVGLYSELPIERLQQVYLDFQSRTSVRLARILLKEYWHKEVKFLEAPLNYRELIGGTTGGVVIGDRALEQNHRSAYCYDLSEAWKAFTGLPFVFAAWVANKKLPETFIQAFNEANAWGLTQIPAVVAENASPWCDLEAYYNHNIQYKLDLPKREGLERFLAFKLEEQPAFL